MGIFLWLPLKPAIWVLAIPGRTIFKMSHTTAVKVIHPNGELFISRKAADIKVEKGRAYWRDLAKTVLVLIATPEAEPASNYEYGGRLSWDPGMIVQAYDGRTNSFYDAPVEFPDRTLIPVRQPGGQKIMQLKPLNDRHSTGHRLSRHDDLWRPRR